MWLSQYARISHTIVDMYLATGQQPPRPSASIRAMQTTYPNPAEREAQARPDVDDDGSDNGYLSQDTTAKSK